MPAHTTDWRWFVNYPILEALAKEEARKHPAAMILRSDVLNKILSDAKALAELRRPDGFIVLDEPAMHALAEWRACTYIPITDPA